ncbi:hypothetical protein [Azospirillum sp. TSO35-2]|uniref:hypothetical protein n=1 Tax=Azospirillum sp. TSO35-2 TaxID=716796 RepID=UPI000D6187CE|nr:hypothetical protein [Azospirillum sp. TSO35-2]PWC37679.1 hypothetical protein TSO352_09170 [Azospirillum sp. TSO35-2]
MTTHAKLRQGTTAWFEMVGTMMTEAAARANLPADLNVSLVERYTDGVELFKDLIQGIRFDIVGGEPSFRIGARRDERADVTIEVTAAAARTLNALASADPSYQTARERFLGTGDLRVTGEVARLGDWLETVHDPIVDRTA